MFIWVLISLYPLQVCGISFKRYKEFRTFWPSSFVDQSVKGTDNFWKIRELIDGFKKLCRQIGSGVEKMADELMSAIRFCTTPKVDLTHYSFIFRKPDPFGTETKKVVCSRSGTMLHLYTQKGKEAMKTSIFQKYIGGNTACMKRLYIATKLCGRLTSNDS